MYGFMYIFCQINDLSIQAYLSFSIFRRSTYIIPVKRNTGIQLMSALHMNNVVKM